MAGEDDKTHQSDPAQSDTGATPTPTPAATIIMPGAGANPASGFPSNPGVPPAPAAPGASYRPIRPGDVLNHIFEVKRFIARGGMGEVFEGINVNSDERVAIKVILPHLAADPSVQAMFRKEARTLTRLGHPALVQYRVLAQEPQLGVFYIVTEYVDGANLSDVIGRIEATPQQLVELIRRLASGLQAAHALGAIHRDIAPDNILLEGGDLSRARIIDFGIAKDLDPGSATIVGDGFAGKLNYVAPEQLGDFGRDVGPWTDIYSLGLTILAIAGRKDVDMGTTMVNAVDKRRAGPDLSAAPEELHPLLAQMLKANPAERVRSMGDLLDLLPGIGDTLLRPAAAQEPTPPAPEPEPEPEADELPSANPIALDPVAPPEPEPEESAAIEALPEPELEPEDVAPLAAWPEAVEPEPEPEPPASELVAAAPPPPPPVAKPAPAPSQKKSGKSALPLVVGGIVVILLAGAGIWYTQFSGKSGSEPRAMPVAGVVGDQVGPAKAALAAALPSVACTWLDVAEVSQNGTATKVTLRGVAGKPSEAQGQIAQMLAAKNIKGAEIDMRDVAPIEASECGPLDALRQIRDAAGNRMRVEQAKIEMAKQTAGNLAGKVGATAVVDFDLADPTQEMSLFGVEPSGKITQITTARAELTGAATDLGGNRYQLPIDVDHQGWSGMLLLTGQPPFDGALLAGPAGSRTGDWSQRFIAAAQERGWKAEMVWFNAVNEQPD